MTLRDDDDDNSNDSNSRPSLIRLRSDHSIDFPCLKPPNSAPGNSSPVINNPLATNTPKLTIIPPQPDILLKSCPDYHTQAVSRSASPSTYRPSPVDCSPETPISQFQALRKRYLRTIWDWPNYLSDSHHDQSYPPYSNNARYPSKAHSFTSSSSPPPSPFNSVPPIDMINNVADSVVNYIKGPDQISAKKKKKIQKSSYFTLFIFGFFSIALISLTCLSFFHLHVEPKYCRMSYMTPSFHRISSFNYNYTRLHSKYSLHLYREKNIDLPFDSSGIPVIFIPGNAGSYRQVRALAAASSLMSDSFLTSNPLLNTSSAPENVKFDYFTVDFQEDLTAFHGRSLFDQAEYLNDAVTYILEMYKLRESESPFPPPKSVILIGHSMGGIVARTMLTLENYRKGSVNTIFTLSAPHTLPPVCFDKEISNIYDSVNRYWEQSFSQDFIGRNPLASVAVISVAGGSLDHMIPSEYASISSTIPPSNGFTVHANSIPHVWAGIDHQAIVWCDQFRLVFAAAMREMADLSVPAKTKALPERMSIFRRHFLGGFDIGAPDYLQTRFHPSVNGQKNNKTFSPPQVQNPDTLLWIEDITKSTLPSGQTLAVQRLGTGTSNAYLMPIPPSNSPKNVIFSLLTDSNLFIPGNTDSGTSSNFPPTKPFNYKSGQVPAGLYAMVCRYPFTETKPSNPSLSVIDLTRQSEIDEFQLVGLLCKNIASDSSKLPKPSFSETPLSPPSEYEYLSFLQYDVSQLSNYDFIAVIDTNKFPTSGFITAEFSIKSSSSITVTNPLRDFIRGITVSLPSSRPTMVDISYSSLWSSLLTFKARVVEKTNAKLLPSNPSFQNFVRQYSGDNYDSRYYLNVDSSTLNVTVFGVAPFSPFGIRENDDDFEGNLFYYGQQSHYYHNLHLQVWSDPSVQGAPLDVVLELDIAGCLGKLVLHYRAAIVTFPIVIVALVLIIQYRIYAAEGTFITFLDGLRIFTSRLLTPFLLLVTVLPYLLKWSFVRELLYILEPDMDFMSGDGPASIFTSIRRNQFFLGLEAGHLWFLGIVFICVAVGLCYLSFYVLSALIYLLALPITQIYKHFKTEVPNDRKLKDLQSLVRGTSPVTKFRRVIVMLILFAAIALAIPYEFAYIVACFVQIMTAVRSYCQCKSLSLTKKKAKAQKSYFNLVLSFLILMFWITPIPLPMLAVWIQELGSPWRITFRSHHNIFAICPVVCFVEIMSTGRMLPRPKLNILRLTTEFFLGYIAFYALLFGIPRAHMLYQLFNMFSAWLVFLYLVDSEVKAQSAAATSTMTSTGVTKNVSLSPSLSKGSPKHTKSNVKMHSSHHRHDSRTKVNR